MAKISVDKIARIPLGELRGRLLSDQRLPPGAEEALAQDGRAGAQALLAAVRGRRQRERAETRRLAKLCLYEQAARAEGRRCIAGVDEAGMAPLAGPVVAAAAILPEDYRPRGLDDSKKLDPKTRETLAVEIRAHAVAWAVGVATHVEIDRLNIYHAGLLAMRRAVEGLSPAPDHLLVDARRVPGVGMSQRGIIKGDSLSLSIAAASVLAKTHRDELLCALDLEYPGYGFASHKGYPTPVHFAALAALGPCAVHRRSFAPVREALARPATAAEVLAPQGELFGQAAVAVVRYRGRSA